jgi:hypothetical protein
MDAKVTNEERLAAAHAALTEAVAKVATSDDWQNLLHISGSFHRYSPNNQLLLAAQGAKGVVASFHTWKQIPAVDGEVCRIRKGEKALRVYAPIRKQHRDVDPDTGELHEPSIVGFRLVPVFHEGQLVAPPDLPAQPRLLEGQEPPREIWDAVAEQIYAAGYALERGPLEGVSGPKGVTNFIGRTVTVRDDLGSAQAIKTQIHELGHVIMHFADVREPGMTRDRIEVEAESVAYVVCDLLGVDAGSYSIPYVANWAGADVELVEATAQKVLTTARQIVTGLEAELGVDLRPNPIASAIRQAAEPEPVVSQPVGRLIGSDAATDQLIADHLGQGELDWPRLAGSIPAVETHRAIAAHCDPGAQAIVLAEAGASPEATATVLRAHGLDDESVLALLTVTVPDQLGATSTLYDRDDAVRAVRNPQRIGPLVDEVVADLLLAAGRHPAGARHLAETSGQPASVINLMEERLRRTGERSAAADRRANRGLALIDEWTSPVPPDGPEPPATSPQLPEPPEPPAA